MKCKKRRNAACEALNVSVQAHFDACFAHADTITALIA